MSVDENKALVRRFVEEVMMARRVEAIPEYFVPGSFLAGGIENIVNTFLMGFPDLQLALEDILADGDKVIIRFTIHGTNTGPFLGHPPTGNSMTATGIHIYRIQDGKIVTAWFEYDLFGTMEQLGLIPWSSQ